MERKWWKEAVVYQIYPRSFQDSNGDGIGDLPGIISRLDYLKELGVDVVWLSPVYKSPNADNGYDISDYRDVMDQFGTLADLDELIAKAHQRGLRVIMDLVPNHTSDQHPWFVASRRRESPWREYYIWRPGQGGGPPNNWGAYFGGSAWTLDPESGEYYLHLFTPEQPDLNWENPLVRQEIYAVMRWWLDRGVDGFRIDCVNLLSKAPGLPDGVPEGGEGLGDGRPYFLNGPRIHEFLREMHEAALTGCDVMTVGESSGTSPETAALYVSDKRGELDMIFSFEHMDIDRASGDRWRPGEWRLTDLKAILGRWYEELKEEGWNSVYFNNHDQPRAISRFGDDREHRVESAKLFATLTLTLPGTPFLYQGEEIGMTNIAFPTIDDYRDVDTLNAYGRLCGRGLSNAEAMRVVYHASRDNARTPMQWDGSPQAGFTTGTPWIDVNPNYPTVNVAHDREDPDSIWHYYRRLLGVRKGQPALVYGEYQPLLEDDPQIWAYRRTAGEESFLVALNFSRLTVTPAWPDGLCGQAQLLLGNYPDECAQNVNSSLRPYEARLYRLAVP